MTNKFSSLKEIHNYLIKNDLMHQSEDYLIKKKILLPKESKKQEDSSSCESRQISLNKEEPS